MKILNSILAVLLFSSSGFAATYVNPEKERNLVLEVIQAVLEDQDQGGMGNIINLIDSSAPRFRPNADLLVLLVRNPSKRFEIYFIDEQSKTSYGYELQRSTHGFLDVTSHFDRTRFDDKTLAEVKESKVARPLHTYISGCAGAANDVI